MKFKAQLSHSQMPALAAIKYGGFWLAMSLLMINPVYWSSLASVQVPFVVLSISPANGATGVSTSASVSATFSLPLVPQTVNTDTVQVRQASGQLVAGAVSAVGSLAIFSPAEPLPSNTSFSVRIVGGSNGVKGSGGLGSTVPLAIDFISTFTTGERSSGGGTSVTPSTGGTVTDPRTGAATNIPANTLKVNAQVKVLTLDSASQIAQIDNSCGVPIQSDETLPEVPGFTRVSQVVRYEVQPCGAIAFGPGMRLTLPLLMPLPLAGPEIRLFELARSNGRLVFLDTGIQAKVTRSGAFPFGNFVTVPAIPSFGTYAAFEAANVGAGTGPSHKTTTDAQAQDALQQTTTPRLYFPIISQENGEQTRISLANPDGTTALNVLFTAYAGDGTTIGSVPQTIAPNQQASFLVSSLFPTMTEGAVIVERQGSGSLTGFSEIADTFIGPTVLGGVEGIQALQRVLVFPIIKSLGQVFTKVHIFNPNSTPVIVQLAGFTGLGVRVNATNSIGEPLDSIALPPFGKLVLSSTGLNSDGVVLDFSQLDGGYIIAETADGQSIVGAEDFGELIGGRMSLALINGLSFPSGCLASTIDPCACQVDASAESSVPSSLRQHTLYATYFEGNPAEQIVCLVNVSESPAELAFSAFDELGQFRGTFPPSGFLTINPHQVFQATVISLFGFNPSPGYVRIEDQDSSFAGGLINRNTTSSKFDTVVPLIADDPQQTQTATTTFFSRIQLDPASANPRQTTGMLIFNPTNNDLQFRIRIMYGNGSMRQSAIQSLVARGMFTRVQQSLSVLFPNLNISSGFAQVQVTTAPGPGMGGRLIPVAIYRSNPVVSAVRQQNKQP